MPATSPSSPERWGTKSRRWPARSPAGKTAAAAAPGKWLKAFAAARGETMRQPVAGGKGTRSAFYLRLVARQGGVRVGVAALAFLTFSVLLPGFLAPGNL